MQSSTIKYIFTAKCWQYNGPNGWRFISLPQKISKEIRQNFKGEEEGWGRLKVIAKVGNSEWKTAIWFDTKQNTYLLPLKADIRDKESINVGEIVTAEISI